MGYIAHDAIVVTTSSHRPGGLPDMDAFRASLPAKFRPLVIGPVVTPLNGYVSYVFLPDGSKEGWDASDLGDESRERFKDLFRFAYEDGSSPDNWIAVRFGGDTVHEQGARITDEHPKVRAALGGEPTR